MSLSRLFIVADLADGSPAGGGEPSAGGVDRTARSIEGLVIPWGEAGRVHGSPIPVMFPEAAAIYASGSDRLLRAHNRAESVGRPIWWKVTAAGIRGKWQVSRSGAGAVALDDAEDGITDGLSVGAEIYGREESGVFVVEAARIEETSLVAIPAYSRARVGL